MFRNNSYHATNDELKIKHQQAQLKNKLRRFTEVNNQQTENDLARYLTKTGLKILDFSDCNLQNLSYEIWRKLISICQEYKIIEAIFLDNLNIIHDLPNEFLQNSGIQSLMMCLNDLSISKEECEIFCKKIKTSSIREIQFIQNDKSRFLPAYVSERAESIKTEIAEKNAALSPKL